ncbi:MAG: hypothetical protein KME26_31390 [Oscillatoria princeps RMCB-10]|jgi:hypothetical protein|nr:hypothetical protein [Oscillatoria princeps RMCB-10]
MVTFEPGIKSPYSLHQFREGEQGMKCLRPNCPIVMTIAEWEQKRRCFCQFTNAVLATARSAPPTRLETNRRTGVNVSNTNSNTPATSSPTPTVNSRPTSSTGSSTSRNTTSLNSISTNSGGSSRTEGSPSSRKWGWAAILCIVFGIGWWTAQLGSFSKNYTALISSIQNRQPQLTPKQVIARYYQLAPSNRAEAKALLSDAFKKTYKQQNPKSNGTSSFWDSVNSVETYAFKTLSNRQIQVWLKYIYKNGETACESRIVELIFDPNKSQWFIDKMPENLVDQNPYCDTQ